MEYVCEGSEGSGYGGSEGMASLLTFTDSLFPSFTVTSITVTRFIIPRIEESNMVTKNSTTI